MEIAAAPKIQATEVTKHFKIVLGDTITSAMVRKTRVNGTVNPVKYKITAKDIVILLFIYVGQHRPAF